MIRSFRDKGLRQFFETGEVRKLSVQNAKRLSIILRALDAATTPGDMNVPGLRFHPLAGREKGRYAVTVTGNWRLTFGWIDNDATEVAVEDYH
jgi:proteic killer suppression protein